MKSRETNPLAAAEPLTPPSAEPEAAPDDWGGRGQVPISVSEGDFSTPTKRTRTTTRPRGLKTLEELAEHASTSAPVFVADPSPSRAAANEPPPAVASGSPPTGHEASVVDEFLAAPPTPAPVVDETPPLEADSTAAHYSASLAPRSTPNPDSIENVSAAHEMRQAALSDRAAERVLNEGSQSAPEWAVESAATAPIPGLPSDGEKTIVNNFLEPLGDKAVGAGATAAQPTEAIVDGSPVAESSGAASPAVEAFGSALPAIEELGSALPAVETHESDPVAVEIDASLIPPVDVELEPLAPSVPPPIPAIEIDIAEPPAPLEPPAPTPSAPTLIFVDAGALDATEQPEIAPEDLQEITLQEEPARTEVGAPAADAPSAAPEPAMSPLAQALAHMAEAMQADLAESEVDIDIADGPLVPILADASAPSRADTPRPRAVPPPHPPALPPDASADGRAVPPPFVGLPEALVERPRRPKRSKPWFEEVFDESYLRTLPFMTAEQTLREVDFIESSLAVPKGAEVLDVACGYGRHAIELVQRGLAVTGLDLSLPLLIRAADESQRRSVAVNFVHTDMREMAFERQFAGAYSMLTSFGYFDEESNLKVAEGIARALKPGGRFLIDVINRDYIVGDLPARVWWEGDGCVVLEETDFNFNTNRIVTHRSVVFEDGQQLEHEISVRMYSLHDLGKLLRQAGFRVIEVSGSIPTRGHFFGATSRNLLILAERRSE